MSFWNEYMYTKNTTCLKWFLQFYYNSFQKNKGGRNRCLVSLFVLQFWLHSLYVRNWRTKSDTRQRFMPGVSLCIIIFFTFLHLKLNLNYFLSKIYSLSIWAFWSKTFLCLLIFGFFSNPKLKLIKYWYFKARNISSYQQTQFCQTQLKIHDQFQFNIQTHSTL